MDYNYESLLDQRFQILCQDLLIREHPGVQCLPIAMPDGGRDAFARSGAGKDVLVYQVKYARNPQSQKDPADWVIAAIQGELEKIERLIDRGMKQYIVMTNMGGTSHQDSGSIDKVQSFLDANIGVPAQCWWRDDLDRRLDNAYDLKLHYPSLISGADAMRLIWELACKGEGAQRRKRALNSYIGHQYEQERSVRFKQAELPSTPLFRLYVDVPIAPHSGNRKQLRHTTRAIIAAMNNMMPSIAELDDDIMLNSAGGESSFLVGHDGEDVRFIYAVKDEEYVEVDVGAADLLLVSDFGRNAPHIVLEGAPGQGKSTLAQYLAQVNRVRMIKNSPDKGEIPPAHARSPLRFPVKLELRDVAQWIDGINPWVGKESVQHNQPTSLEGALAGHIHQYSGGVGFDVSDLLALFETVPVLLILDALDEVANLDQRRKVVREVEACLSRLRQQDIDLQVLVTSRPTAIAESPTFSSEHFLYLTLAPLSKRLALHYAERWASTRGLDKRDSEEISRILEAKMSAPHMADLAKNTMQLSILLSLIHLRGESLPEQRTELYDTYIDVFFNRESEKSDIVKKHRALLIDIHRYLGFYLHAKAENSRTTGRISADELKSVVSDYLLNEHRPVDVLDELLIGMVERVVALVSRVEGTYEFEVQPLREYFAARHLYDTASYSPAGRNRTGTKPDRFDGIAPSPYWLNVTRFYAGCYSKGELLDLADRLCELIASLDKTSRTYPRRLGVALLQDWVFNQSPKATKKAVDGVFDNFGLRWATIEQGFSGSTGSLGDVNLRLTESTGARILLASAWEYAISLPHTEALANLCSYIRALKVRRDVQKLWKEELLKREGDRRDQWIEVGSWLNVYIDDSPAELIDLLDTARENGRPYRFATIARSGINIEGLPEATVSELAAGVLNYPRQVISERQRFVARRSSPLLALSAATSPNLWTGVAMQRRQNDYFIRSSEEINSIGPQWSKLSAVKRIIEICRRGLHERGDLAVWREITSELRATFGRTWTEIELGVMSGSVRSGNDAYVRADNLISDDWTLPDRMRSARRRSGRPNWWQGQLEQCSDPQDYGLWALAAFAWTTPAAFAILIDDFNRAMQALTPELQENLAHSCRRSWQYSPHTPALRLEQISNFEPMTIWTLFNCLDEDDQLQVISDRARGQALSPFMADTMLSFANRYMAADGADEDQAIELMRYCQSAGAGLDVVSRRSAMSRRLSAATARRIMDDSWNMPTSVLASAIRVAGNKEPTVKPVWQISAEEGWFSD